MHELLSILQILMIDIALAGDNAIAVGMAAAGLPVKERKAAVLYGLIAATVLRILFAFFATQLMRVTGVLAAGGVALFWVSWKMYRDIRAMQQGDAAGHGQTTPSAKSLKDAIIQIIIADVSMSLDNVLGVAGVARDDVWVMAVGLMLAVLLMGVASNLIARYVSRYPVIAYIGLTVMIYTAVAMTRDGIRQLWTLWGG